MSETRTRDGIGELARMVESHEVALHIVADTEAKALALIKQAYWLGMISLVVSSLALFLEVIS